MGNCASARTKYHNDRTLNQADEEPKTPADRTDPAALSSEVTHLRRELDATTAYAQGIAHEATTLRGRLRELEERPRQSTPSFRVLQDGTVVRAVAPSLGPTNESGIRQGLYEFLMWEKDDVVEKCRYMQRELDENEVSRKEAEEEVKVLRREMARTPTPTPLSDVRVRILENIEAIKNGTWQGREERPLQKRSIVLTNSRDPAMRDRQDPRPVDQYMPQDLSTKQATSDVDPFDVLDRPELLRSQSELEEKLQQKTEALTMQEHLVQSLLRERGDLRKQLSNSTHPSRSRANSRTTLNYAETQMSLARHSTAPRHRHRDPADSAVEVPSCLDCEDLQAEIWCLSRSIEQERASAQTLQRECIEAREETQGLLYEERAEYARQTMLLRRYQRKLKKVCAELATSRTDAGEMRARLRKYKVYARKQVTSNREHAAALSKLEGPSGSQIVASQAEMRALKAQLGRAHARIVDLAASKEQAEAKVLLQQRELRETRRLAMRQSRRGSSNGKGW